MDLFGKHRVPGTCWTCEPGTETVFIGHNAKEDKAESGENDPTTHEWSEFHPQ